MVNMENSIHPQILENLKYGKAVTLPLEKWKDLLLRSRWTQSYLKTVLDSLKENAYMGQFLIEGYEGNGKTQLIFFLKEHLQREGKTVIYIDKIQDLEHFVAEFPKLGDSENIIIILDNIDEEIISDQEKFSHLYSKLISLVKRNLTGIFTIILALRTETIMVIRESNSSLMEILRNHKIILDLNLTKEDLYLYAKDAAFKFSSILISGEEDVKIIKGYLTAILLYYIKMNKISNLRNLIIQCFNEIDFISEALCNVKKEGRELKVSRKIGLIKKKVSEVINHFFSNYAEDIDFGSRKLKVRMKSGNKRNSGTVLFNLEILCLDNCDFSKRIEIIISIETANEVDEKILKADSLSNAFHIVLDGETEEIGFDILTYVFLPMNVLKYVTILSYRDSSSLILSKLFLDQRLRTYLNLVAIGYTLKDFEKSNVLSKGEFIELASWATIYVFLKILSLTKDIFWRKVAIRTLFKKCITLFFGNLELNEKLIDDTFYSLLSLLQRMDLVFVSQENILPYWEKFHNLEEIISRVSNEIVFRLKFYLL
ncbi:MAG: hypothetical protein ACP6IP_05650 [Candidatus Njordarchaeia archaeon]